MAQFYPFFTFFPFVCIVWVLPWLVHAFWDDACSATLFFMPYYVVGSLQPAWGGGGEGGGEGNGQPWDKCRDHGVGEREERVPHSDCQPQVRKCSEGLVALPPPLLFFFSFSLTLCLSILLSLLFCHSTLLWFLFICRIPHSWPFLSLSPFLSYTFMAHVCFSTQLWLLCHFYFLFLTHSLSLSLSCEY